MTLSLLWNPMELLLWGIGISAHIFGAFFFFFRGRQKELLNEKIFLYGSGFLVLFTALHRLLFIIAEFQLTGDFINGGFYGEPSSENIFYKIFYIAAFTSSVLGFMFYIFALELNIRSTKFILTIICGGILILLLISSVLLPFELAMSIINPLLAIFVIISIFITYTYLTFRSSPKFKTVILFFFLYSQFIWLTFVFVSLIPIEIAPLLFIFSIFIFIIPLYINPEFFSKNLTIWGVIEIFQVILTIILTWFFLSLTPIGLEYITITISFPLFYTFILLQIRHYNKQGTISGEIQGKQEILAIFSRPQRLTEEEVSISKEKKICLVCKNSGLRFTYICPDCNAIYCQKCATALSGMENACWVCGSPFDESKPVKLPEKQEAEASIEEPIVNKDGGTK